MKCLPLTCLPLQEYQGVTPEGKMRFSYTYSQGYQVRMGQGAWQHLDGMCKRSEPEKT